MDDAQSKPAPDDRYARGLAALRQVTGTEHPAVLDPLGEIAPDLRRFTIEFGYGDIWSRPGLTPRQRQIITIASLAALGNAPAQLGFHIGGALNVGVTRREVVETFIQVSVYAGFPAALNALAVAGAEFAARPPTADTAEPAAEPAADPDRHARGLAALTAVNGPAGAQVLASLADIAPDLGRYLIEYVYGDIYSRGGLDLRTRELATVAMCAALGTAGPQLRLHIAAFLTAGGTRAEIVELMTQLAGYAGFPAALNGAAAAAEVFAAPDPKNA